MKAIEFINISDKTFSWTWDKVPYSFEPGRAYMMEEWKANHFAKHLANHMLNNQGKSVADPSRIQLIKKMLPDGETLEAPASQIETKLLQHDAEAPPEPVLPGKKRGRPPKVKDEETFEGLKA